MKKHKVGVQFAVILILSACAGAVCSSLLYRQQTTFLDLLHSAEAFFHQNVLWIYPVVSILLLIPTIAFYLKGKQRAQALIAAQNEETESADHLLNLSTLFCTMGMPLQFFFFASAAYYGFQEHSARYVLIPTLFLVLFGSLITFFSVRCIKWIKLLYPTKHADPLDLQFDKKWVQESDEQEQFTMYRAAFKSFMLLKYTFIFSWVVLILIGLIVPIGILPFFLISLLWAIHSCSYMFYSNAAYGEKQKR